MMVGRPSDRELIRRFRQSDQKVPQGLFGSQFAVGLAPTLVHLDADRRRSVMHFSPGEDYVTALGTLQGGIVATMLDFTMVFLVLALIPEDARTSTANLNVSYLKPAVPGSYCGEGEIERAGRTMYFCRALLRTRGNDLVATATAIFPISQGSQVKHG